MLKVTGIVKRVDQLGRIVLPIELRRTLGIRTDDPLEVLVDEESILLKRYAPVCTLCGNPGETKIYKGKRVCKNCLRELRAQMFRAS